MTIEQRKFDATVLATIKATKRTRRLLKEYAEDYGLSMIDCLDTILSKMALRDGKEIGEVGE